MQLVHISAAPIGGPLLPRFDIQAVFTHLKSLWAAQTEDYCPRMCRSTHEHSLINIFGARSSFSNTLMYLVNVDAVG